VSRAPDDHRVTNLSIDHAYSNLRRVLQYEELVDPWFFPQSLDRCLGY
jgi:hypothetical protein